MQDSISDDQKYNAPVIYMDSIKSIHKNYNIAWTNKAHLIIAKVLFFFLNIFEGHQFFYEGTDTPLMDFW